MNIKVQPSSVLITLEIDGDRDEMIRQAVARSVELMYAAKYHARRQSNNAENNR